MSKYITISQELAENIYFYLNDLRYCYKSFNFHFSKFLFIRPIKKTQNNLLAEFLQRIKYFFFIDLELYVKKS